MLIKALVNFPVFVEVEVDDDLSPSAIKDVVKDYARAELDDSQVDPIIAEIDIVERHIDPIDMRLVT